MRYAYTTLAAAILILAATAGAETATPQSTGERVFVNHRGPSSPAQSPEAAEPIPLPRAAETFAVAQAAEADIESNIFDHIKIELLDLQKLGREIDEKLSGEAIRLDLDQCIRMALDANHDIIVVSYEPLKSEADFRAAKGEFDPVLSGSLNYTYSSQAASSEIIAFSQIQNIESYNSNADITLNGRLHWGTQYNIRFNIDRQLGTFSGFFEDFSGGISVTLTQPMLRGFGKRVNLANIRSAKKLHGISESQLRLTVLNTIGEVLKAYWDLVGTIENLDVRQESLANAQRLVEVDQRRLEIGTAAAIEVLQAKAGVAVRQSDLIAARTAIANAEDRLKRLLSMRDGDLFSSKRIIPTSSPSMKDFEWDIEGSMRTALEKRPEMHSAELEIENAQIAKTRARNSLLPQVDLSATYIQGGRNLDLGGVFDGISDRQDQIYRFGVTGSVPIPNRAARNNYERSRLTVRQAEERFKQTEDDVMLNVRIAAHGALTSEILVESNRQTRILQEANVAAEEKRLRLGVTTSYRVLQIQEDLTAAQTQEVQATINFEKSLVELQVAEGTLLEHLGIEYESQVESQLVSIGETLNPVRVWKNISSDRTWKDLNPVRVWKDLRNKP